MCIRDRKGTHSGLDPVPWIYAHGCDVVLRIELGDGCHCGGTVVMFIIFHKRLLIKKLTTCSAINSNLQQITIYQHYQTNSATCKLVLKVVNARQGEGWIGGNALLMCRVRGSFWSLLESGEASWHDSTQRELLRSILMTTCDIAAISKPWNVQMRVANLVLSEFFEQGDKERHQLKIQPQVTWRSPYFTQIIVYYDHSSLVHRL